MATRIHIVAAPAGKTNLPASLFLHALLAGGLVLYGYIHHAFHNTWGSDTQSIGVIQASMVDAIPLPTTAPPSDNVLATETPSPTPAPKTLETVAKPNPDEVLIQNKNKPQTKTKVAEKTTPQVLHPQQPTQANRIPQGEAPGMRVAISQMQLTNGVQSISVPGSDFGTRFAYYQNQIARTVAANWWRQEADPASSAGRHVVFVFDILRDGTLTNVKLERSSGSATLDASARHTMQRIETFGPLPDAYRGDRITVEYQFDYPSN